MKKKKLLVCFSSGLSSAMMCDLLIREYSDEYEMVFLMANTSKEDVRSLEFAEKVNKYFNLNLKYVEADIFLEKGVGTRHIVKTYENLTTDGSLFEKGIKKYGIPNKINKWCNRELKLNAIHSYVKNELKWKDYYTAIGIRYDELDRVSINKERDKLIYPLVDHKLTKRDRNKFWDKMPFKLEIPGYLGNCDMCFEKTNRKLMTIYKEYPKKIDWWLNMELKYSKKNIEGKDSYNGYINNKGGMYFRRGNMPMNELIELAKQPFRKASDEYVYENDLFDFSGECDGGCNIFNLK